MRAEPYKSPARVNQLQVNQTLRVNEESVNPYKSTASQSPVNHESVANQTPRVDLYESIPSQSARVSQKSINPHEFIASPLRISPCEPSHTSRPYKSIRSQSNPISQSEVSESLRVNRDNHDSVANQTAQVNRESIASQSIRVHTSQLRVSLL